MRKSISVAFFSTVSTLMVLGIVLMGGSEWLLFSNYFAKDRYATLDEVVNVTRRTAQYLVQEAALPEGEELDTLSTKLEIIGESLPVLYGQRGQRAHRLQPGQAQRLRCAGSGAAEDRRGTGKLPPLQYHGRRAHGEELYLGQ